jgi:ERCC4-type nuclease
VQNLPDGVAQMILVDRREKPQKREKAELADKIELVIRQQRLRIEVEKAELPYGDIAFDGFGRSGPISVGIERKKLTDLNNCIEDGRLSGHQLIGMKHSGLYQECWLLVEGMWRPHDPGGHVMASNNGADWWEFKPSSRRVDYSKLRRYLFSVQRSGVPLLYTRDIYQTAYDIVELYQYYQKRDHDSMLVPHTANIPALMQKPPLVFRWAYAIDGIGTKMAEEAARLFKTPYNLATAPALQWLAIRGVGDRTAMDIERQIEGK